MSAECCAHRSRLRLGLAYTPAALVALLLPKHPLCLGGLLALLGLSLSVPDHAYALALLVSVASGTVAVVRAHAT